MCIRDSTLRESHNASENGWSAMLYDVASNEYCFSKKYELKIIDRVGGGDSFGGGLIYALLNGKSTQDAVSYTHLDVYKRQSCIRVMAMLLRPTSSTVGRMSRPLGSTI